MRVRARDLAGKHWSSSERTIQQPSGNLLERGNGLRVAMLDLRLDLFSLCQQVKFIRSTRLNGDDQPGVAPLPEEIDALLFRVDRISARAGVGLCFEGLLQDSGDEIQSARVRSCVDQCRTLFRPARRSRDGAEERRTAAAYACENAVLRSALSIVDALQIAEEHFATKIGVKPLPPIPR